MSAPNTALADAISDNLAGQRRADTLLAEIAEGTGHPDQLHAVALKVWSDHGTPGLLGFHRRLQKALERRA